MSKEDYAEEIKRHTYFYFQGRDEERKRILKLIDEKIKNGSKEYHKEMKEYKKNPRKYDNMADTSWIYNGYSKALEELKEELEKK